MRLVPFSLLQTLELKDEQGDPWVPSVRDSMLIVPLGAVVFAVILEAMSLLNYFSESGASFEWTRVLLNLAFILANYYFILLPLFILRRRASMKKKYQTED